MTNLAVNRENMNETALIQKAQQGDVHSFNELVLEYQDLAYSVAYRIMQNDTAADITQIAFISAFEKIDQFKGGSFKAWMMRIVTNACYDELRRLKRHSTSSLDEIQEDTDGLDLMDEAKVSFISEPIHPEASVQRNELQAIIEECIKALSDIHRIVVVMADIEQYRYEEIADIAGVSLGTVKSRLSRARANLRDCLQTHRELLPEKYRLGK
jgi:RNA polymerase sigma-70 factor (ECF subfamily)